MEAISHIPENAVPPMSNADIVRAWKDARYRSTLSAEQLQRLPGNPAGPAELIDDELKLAGGLTREASFPVTTALGCTESTFHQWTSCGCP